MSEDQNKMEDWQFFLQKEGDYAWLPLETPQVEILEGRYQLIAHTSTVGTSVRVNIRHRYEQENIPQENIQESVRQIELSGKVEILPLVYLGLGSWSITCYPKSESQDRTSSDRPESYSLDIQVLSQDFDLFEDWNFDLPETIESDSSSDTSFIPRELELADLVAGEQKSPAVLTPSVPVEAQLETLPSDLELASAKAQRSDQDPVPSLQEFSDEVKTTPAVQHHIETTIESSSESASAHGSDTLILPTFSDQTPTIEFRTVSPKELPRPVSDCQPSQPNQHHSPQLPSFTLSKAVVTNKQDQRHRSLSKIQIIAAAVKHQGTPNELSRSTRQEKFQSKLHRIAVGADKP